MTLVKTLLPVSLLCAGAVCADTKTMQIPEGKLQDHPSLFGDITPSAGPRVIGGSGVFLTGDYIYWTAREDGLEFALSGAQIDGSLPTKAGHKYDPRFRFQSGFKAGVGFSFGHDKWDSYINYTWLRTQDNHKSVDPVSGAPLTNLIPVAAEHQYSHLSYASARWNLHFNVIDASLGRNFYISKFLSLRPFFGAKGTWQSQSLHVKYDFTTQPDINSKNKNDFWGIGLMMGVNTAWHFGGTWSLYADGALSTLWGAFYVKRSDKNPSTGVVYYDAAERTHSIKPVVELGAGLRKEMWIYHDRFHISWQAGWEQQVWFSQNQFDFYTSQRQGDLNIQGFSTRLRFDF